jgi:hypothetical protein
MRMRGRNEAGRLGAKRLQRKYLREIEKLF